MTTICRVPQTIEQIKPGCELGVDGDIHEVTASLAGGAGANVLVAGRLVFGADQGDRGCRGIGA